MIQPPFRSRLGAGLVLALVLTLGGCALRPGAVAYLTEDPGRWAIVAQTTYGRVEGVGSKAGDAFLAIPFAAPPIGPLRWRAPQPPSAWAGVRDATRSGAACPQGRIPGAERTSEECLTLNVYGPPDAQPSNVIPGRRLPVMVWLYGGGYAIGGDTSYDPSVLARRQGVVVVAPNYRLGALGFLAHPALKGEAEGSYAIADQQAALRWVRDNIARFGGDPHNVTLFGESAGAWSACTQLVAPGARGLFQRVILESGSCTSPDSALAMSDAEAGGAKMAAALGCGDPATAADCLRRVPASRLIKAKPYRRGLLGLDSWSPAYGGDVLPLAPKAAFAAGHVSATPVIDGTNHDEGRLFLAANRWRGLLWTRASYERIIHNAFQDKTSQVLAEYAAEARRTRGLAYADIVTDSTFACPALTLNRLLGAGGAQVWAYEFDDPDASLTLWRPPFTPPLRAYHASELAYVLQTRWAIADPAKFDRRQRALSDHIQAYWGAFAQSGDPNVAVDPSAAPATPWPNTAASPEAPLVFTPDAIAPDATFARRHRCGFWNGLGY